MKRTKRGESILILAAHPQTPQNSHSFPSRAYIAASRRSDRSLEARVESARRASEIHKKRTGRSLRVTEQDVVNEEMYEEEDDDLPLQYRRLTAHLNTGSSDFNRRLAAYLTNSVAMRAALDQAMSGGAYPQPYGQTWQQNSQLMQQQMQQGMPYPQPMNVPMAPQTQMLPPQALSQSPTSYRQAPYPLMPAQGYRQGIQQQHAVSADVAAQANSQSPQADVRRQSPQQAPTQALNASRRSTSASSLTALAQEESTDGSATSSSAQPLHFSHPLTTGSWSPVHQTSYGPFSTALPGDAQTFFNPGFMGNASFTQNLMPASDKAQPFYSYNPNAFNKLKNVHPSYDGMSQTLAPGALDTNQDEFNWPTPPTDGVVTPINTAFNYSLDTNFDLFKSSNLSMPSPNIMQDSGLVTPGDKDWASFIDQSSWEETA